MSNDTKEIIRISWETSNEGVHIADKFALRSIIKSYNRSENYLIMLLSQSGVQLYEALNDAIVQEITNEDFPFTENPHYVHGDKRSDPKHLDNLVREFFNKVDKALVRVSNETDLNCIVVCTEDNFNKLQQVADRPAVYIGFSPVNYNDTSANQIVKQSWEIVKAAQKQRRTLAIAEMKEAISHGKVLTDLQEIYQAAIDGRGDLLIVHQNFSQPVIMKDERTFELTDNPAQENAIDDITSTIAWEVISKKGRIFFTSQDEIKDIGKIVLKTRY